MYHRKMSKSPTNRRDFLRQLAASSAVLAAPSWLSTLGYAQTRGPAVPHTQRADTIGLGLAKGIAEIE